MSCAPGAPPASNSGTQKPAAETGSASSGGAPSNAAHAAKEAQPAASVAGEPKYGGRFSVQVVDDPFDWDPTDRGKSLPNQWGLSLAYESLVGFKNGPGVSFEAAQLEPELAERWEVSPDSSVFTFFLRKGVKFANMAPVNGREMTSADVKWSYEYFSRTGDFKDKGLQKAQYDWMFENLKSVDVVDPYTVKVTFSEPFAPFLYYAGSPFIPIMPHEIYDQDSHFHDKIVGTGMGTVKEFPAPVDECISELARRTAAWRPRAVEALSGVLEKYARLVGPAHLGAVTHSGPAPGADR